MKRVRKKKILSYLIVLFLAIYLVLSSVIFYIYKIQKKIHIRELTSYSNSIINQQKDLILSTIYPSITDIYYMSKKRSLQNFDIHSKSMDVIKEDMKLFAKSNWDYKQLRFIDKNGLERIRLNWIKDSVVNVPDSLLQNKSERDYYKKTMALERGEVYISPIDLNIEHNRVEHPLKAMIRFGTPVFNENNELNGILVINQNLNTFFEIFQSRFTQESGEHFLLDADGYFLLAPEEFERFGFMFSNKKQETFQNYYPAIWREIKKKPSGSYMIKNDLYIYNYTDIFRNYRISSNKNLNNSIVNDSRNQWHFIIHIDSTSLLSIAYLNKLMLYSLLLLVPLVLLVSYFISRARVSELLLIHELKDLNLDLEKKVERRTRLLGLKNRELENANEELEAFSYSVSHDLRAPLRHISGFIDLFFKKNADVLDEKGRYYLNTIKDSALGMKTLIEDLLVFSRVGRTDLKKQTVDLNALVEEVIPIIESDFSNHTIKWEKEALPKVYGDYTLLRQVFFNYMHNAVKYSSNKKVSAIKIGTYSKNQFVICFISDNGSGFDMNYNHKLFNTFQRLHHKDEYEGTGIGLAIVKRIITRHGGETWAESKVAKGSTFYFSLPVHSA